MHFGAEWRMDGYRLPCGKCRCTTHILHLCQLGVPDWCLSVQILWPPVPGRPYLVALSLHGFCRDPCRATPSLSLCMNGLGVNVSSKSIRLQVGLWLQANRTALYVMPVLQVGLLAIFLAVAVLHVMYSWWLLLLCLCTGPPSSAHPTQV